MDVTLPLLRPTIVFLVVVSSIAFLRIFDYVYGMTNGQGGPARLDASRSSCKIYETAFGHFQMGYATAQTVVLFAILLTISLAAAPAPAVRMSRADDGRGPRGRAAPPSGRCSCSGGVLMVMPFVYMLSTSLKQSAEVYELSLAAPVADARQLPPARPAPPGSRAGSSNSLVIATITTLSVLFFDSLVGYTLAEVPVPRPPARLPGDPEHADDPDRRCSSCPGTS